MLPASDAALTAPSRSGLYDPAAFSFPRPVDNHQLRSLKQLYQLAYQWAFEKEPDLPQEEITIRVSIITDYLDFVWKHKQQKMRRSSTPHISS
jgi:hypothetical protein